MLHAVRLLKFILPFLVAVAFSAFAAASFAQTYPNRPVRLVVPFPAGGTTDILARAIAQKLSESLGQSFVVDNRPGAGGNIGSDVVAKSAPDGYTLLMGTVGTHAINPGLYPKMPYDHVKDFAPVVLVAGVPNVLVVNPNVPVKTVVALAKDKPGSINFASSGSGTSIHLSGELFKSLTGTQITHVPYKGSSPALTDLIGGQVQIMFDNLPSAMPHIKGGTLRAIALTSSKRAPALPDLPTIAESGIPSLAGFEASSWFGIFAPAGTPREVVTRINAEANRALQSPEMKEKLLAQGAEAVGNTPEYFADYIRAETTKWAKVVKDSGAKVD